MAMRVSHASGTVAWSDGTAFTGYVLIGFKGLLDGSSVQWPSISMGHQFPKRTLPAWTKIPIVDGAYNTKAGLYYSADMQPPNAQYVAELYDINDKLVSSFSSGFTVTADTFALSFTAPTLPTIGSNPTPDT